MQLYGLKNLYVLHRKRNIDLLVIHFALKRNLVTKKVLALLAGLAQQSQLYGQFSARLARITASQYRDPSWRRFLVCLTDVPRSWQTEPACLT